MLKIDFSCSVSQCCPALRPHGLCSTPGFPVLHHLLEFALTHVHWVSTANQASHPFVIPFQSFPASKSFPVSQLFVSGSQSMETSASSSVLPVNIQGCFPLGLTGLISLQSTGLPRVFSGTAVQRQQFFCSQPLLLSTSYIHIWLLGKL